MHVSFSPSNSFTPTIALKHPHTEARGRCGSYEVQLDVERRKWTLGNFTKRDAWHAG
jgi:hypothetical protein